MIIAISLAIFGHFTLTLILVFLCMFIRLYELYKERKKKYFTIMKMILSSIMFGAVILVILGAIFYSSIFWSLNVFAFVTFAIAILIMNHYEEKERRKNIC